MCGKMCIRDRFQDAPRSADLAAQYDTRKTVRQTQGGLVYKRHVDGANTLRLMLYYGQRDTTQFQACLLYTSERLSYEIADALRAGTCDIGVLADSTDLHGLQVLRFRHDPLALVLPPGHRLAGRETALLADVADEEFVGLVEGLSLTHI